MMKTRTMRTNVWTIFLAVSVLLWWLFVSRAHGEGVGVDVCRIVTGETVAQAVQGRIVETKAAEGRCVYIIALPEGGGTRRAFVVYRHDAAEYVGLRAAQEGEVTMLAGLGDEAILTFDKEAKRYWLLVVKMGLVVLQVSGEDPGQVRRVAEVALQKFAER